jgi:hypothetical protein
MPIGTLLPSLFGLIAFCAGWIAQVCDADRLPAA